MFGILSGYKSLQMNSVSIISSLIDDITQHLENRQGIPGVWQILDAIKSTPRSVSDGILQTPNPPVHPVGLSHAIAAIPVQGLATIANGICQAWDFFNWGVDQGQYYESGSNVGDAYRFGNMSTILIGPTDAVFSSNNLLLGIYYLEPNVLYRDHAHTAPELYLNLTGPTRWRFGTDCPWQIQSADSIVWNPSGTIHATHVGASPFLAIFAWIGDINCLCHVVPADDWHILQSNSVSSETKYG